MRILIPRAYKEFTEVLDCRNLNKHLHKYKHRYEDNSIDKEMYKEKGWGLFQKKNIFDLKFAYHHI